MIVAKRELANVLGLSERHVSSLVTAGVLPKRTAKGFDLIATVKAYVRYLKQPVPGDLKSERTRVTKLKGDLLALELQRQRGEVLSSASVQEWVWRTNRPIRDRLLSISARCGGLCAAEHDAATCSLIIEREVKAVLTDLATDIRRLQIGRQIEEEEERHAQPATPTTTTRTARP